MVEYSERARAPTVFLESKSECELLGGWLKVPYILKYASKGARTYGRLRKNW